MSKDGHLDPLHWEEPLPSSDDRFVLPAGTVTLLVADADGEPWTEPLDDTAGEAVGRYGGVRQLRDGAGDSGAFVAAFDRASDAVGAALLLQQRAGQTRIAVHTGEVARSDGHRHVAGARRRAVRMRDVGHRGQILLSHSAAQLVVDDLPTGAALVDLGLHRLHDLLRPERLWQLEHPDLASTFPSLRSLDDKVRLPVQRTEFIGRDREIAELVTILSTSSLLTLTGAGGCGKTRLAVQLASDVATSFADGVVFVDLAAVESTELVGAAAAAALGIGEDPSRPATEVVASALAQRSVLVVLDNCEHMIDGAARLADALLRCCPAVAVLATSREALAVDGEVTWRVPSMTLPSNDAVLAVEGLPRYEAVALFCNRAARSRPGFALDNSNAAAIIDICRRLDGIPLAIELAAARTRVLTPDQIARGLEDRFRLLVGGARTAVPRQQTLRASVDWSHALLTEPERVVLHRLAVFAGGFTIDAAEAVCVGGEVAAHHVLDLLSLLVDKSLVLANEGAEGRFRVLETVRQYAFENLASAGDDASARERHLHHFAALAASAAPHLDGPEQARWHDRLQAERSNLDAALAWGANGGDVDLACRLAADLFTHWYARMQASSAATALPGLLDCTAGAEDLSRARVLVTHAYLVGACSGDLTNAPTQAQEALDIACRVGDAWTQARALNVLAHCAVIDSPADAIEPATKGIAVAVNSGDVWAETDCTLVVALAEQMRGHLPAATASFRRASELARSRGHEQGIAEALVMLGLISVYQGDLDAAQALLDEGDELARRLSHGLFLGAAQAGKGAVLRRRGSLDEAWPLCSEGAEMAHEISPTYATMADLEVASTALDRGDPSFAAELAVESARTWHELGWRIFEAPWLALLGDARVALGDVTGATTAFQQTLELTKSWDERQSTVYARLGLARLALAEQELERAESLAHDALDVLLGAGADPLIADALDVLAVLAVEVRRDRDAVRLAGATDAWRAASGYVRPSRHVSWWDAAITSVESRLDADELATARSQGAGMSLDGATAFVRRGRGKRGRPDRGWASLTPTENQVVDLVVRGLSNPDVAALLFMSRRTVQTHLTHVYAKLGLASRGELAAAHASRVDRS